MHGKAMKIILAVICSLKHVPRIVKMVALAVFAVTYLQRQTNSQLIADHLDKVEQKICSVLFAATLGMNAASH